MVGLTWKAVFVKSLNRTSVINITNRSNKKKWRSSWNLDELNEFSLAGGSKKTRKWWFPLPSLQSFESLVSVKENADRKRKKEDR